MQEHVTLLGPEESPADARGLSSSLPPDLMEQVRGRVRLLALLLLVAFSAICFIIALTSFWQAYLQKGIIPSLTWVPAVVILFPLILPGPPRRMLIAAVTAGAMAPLALLVLDLAGKAPVDSGAYVDSVFGSLLAIGFAYMGARVVYRLGREVAAARELGSYRLEEKLGEGGMGEVWRARHRMLARPAAIKLIRPGTTQNGRAIVSDDARRRFEREAQVIARAKDPTQRPQSARDLSKRLAQIDGAAEWTQDRAREWWSRHEPVRA